GAATPAADRAAAWLRASLGDAPAGQRADAVVGLAAAGRPRAEITPLLTRLSREAPAYARTVGGAAKVALAAAAGGADPRRLGGVDYVARVRRGYAAGRFGATAFDQGLAMLALRAAGERVPAGAVAALRAGQAGGGWGFELRTSRPDDCSSTGLLVEALRAAGVPARDRMIRRALTWLAARRNREGGYAFDCAGGPTEANTTAFVIRAFTAAGRPAPPGAGAALRRLQRADGGVAFRADTDGSRLLATLDALPALAGVPLPPPPAR
ncbi:MAG: hypothetical protein AB1416_10235, partial [Actinomycetota bacterium]